MTEKAPLSVESLLSLLRDGFLQFGTNVLGRGLDARIGSDMSGGIETAADRFLAEKLISIIRKLYFGGLVIAEAGKGVGDGDPRYGTIAIDELDGTRNFHRKRAHSAIAVALFSTARSKDELTFGHLVGSGVVHLYDGRMWISHKNAAEYSFMFSACDAPSLQYKRDNLRVSGMKQVGRDTLMFFDFNMAQDRALAARMFSEGVFHCMNNSSAALDLMEIAQGTADAYISMARKSDELAPAYPIIKGAGGVIIDPRTGKDIGALPYIFGCSYPVVAAATAELGEELAGRIRKIQGW